MVVKTACAKGAFITVTGAEMSLIMAGPRALSTPSPLPGCSGLPAPAVASEGQFSPKLGSCFTRGEPGWASPSPSHMLYLVLQAGLLSEPYKSEAAQVAGQHGRNLTLPQEQTGASIPQGCLPAPCGSELLLQL